MSIKLYKEMLRYRRPDRSDTEQAFIDKFIKPLGTIEDDFGNEVLKIGNAPIIWSSHTDTVHGKGGMQRIQHLKGSNFVQTAKKSTVRKVTIVPSNGAVHKSWAWSEPLGADCTTGVYLMHQMIEALVEGLYIFHRGEETGGRGSKAINKEYADDIKTYQAAIAFDRQDYKDVITHQAGGRCCSDTFARSLSKELNRIVSGGTYRPSSHGVFTDTANYTDNVGECTNISVGYWDQHTSREQQDVEFLERLRDGLLKFDYTQLVFERKAGESDPDDAYGRYVQYFNNNHDYAHDQLTVEDFVRSYPLTTTDFLKSKGYDYDDLIKYLESVRSARV